MFDLGQVLPSLATPGLAWAGAAAVSVPIAIHLLTRLRRRPVRWGAMRFLMEAFRRHRHRLRVEQLLLLAIRCLIMVLLGLALSGPILEAAGLGAAGQAGNTLLLVLDDSLSTRARVADGADRFARLRRTARSLVNALQPTDELVVWRSGRPGSELLSETTIDHDRMARELEALEPRYSRSDLNATLRLAAAHIESRDRPRHRVFVAVLSDWARDSLNLEWKHDEALARLGENATVLLSRPMAAADNTQIVSLRPLRHLILADCADRATIPVEVMIRRFTADAPAASNQIDLRVAAESGIWSATSRAHQWVAGERVSAPLNFTLQLRPPDRARGISDLDGRVVVVKATVRTPLGDSLEADDERTTLVQLRRRLSVAMIDEASDFSGDEPAPRHWLGAALAPNAGRGGDQNDPVSLLNLTASALDATSLAAADAAAVLRPDLLDRSAWAALRRFVDQGGLVALFVPAVDGSASWGAMLAEVMGVDWQLGLEPVEPDSGMPWSLAADQPVPEVFGQLTSDWQALLRPVRVYRRLPLTITGSAHPVWLRLNDAPRAPLMAAARVGDGTVAVLATAVSSQWTNLPTKPLWLPLLHEMLRGVLGDSGEPARLAKVLVGDTPVLGTRWSGALRLVDIDDPDSHGSVALERTEDAIVVARELDRPGVYRTQPPSGMKLSVNIDPEAADTRSLDDRSVAEWFAAWSEPGWLDDGDPTAALKRQAPLLDATWPLLWLVMVLVVFETCAARWFSHATMDRGREHRLEATGAED